MGFSNQERINMNSKALAASVLDANPVAQWYETRNPFSFLLSGRRVIVELASIPAAGSLSAAQTNATNNPTLITNLSTVGAAIRMTAVAGTNNSTYVAYQTYNDTTSARLDNWLQPQLIPQTSGAASIGYTIILYDGDPNAGGSEVTTTDGTTGTGSSKSVGWIFNYAEGMLLLSDDFKASVSDPYIMGFRYIGRTGDDIGSNETTMVADETIAVGDLLRVVQTGEVGLTAGRVVKAACTSAAASNVVGVAVSGGSQGTTLVMAMSGKVGVQAGSGIAATNNGKKVYLSSTSGRFSLTPPSSSGNFVVKIGVVVGADGSTATPNVLIDIQEIITID